METLPLHRNADAILTERIAETGSGIARRDFLRIAGMAGLGLGFQSALAEGVSPDSATAKAGAEIIPPGDLLVGLDMGTCKVCAAVGERQPDGAIKIHGIGQAPSLGIRGGEVVDPEASGGCVREALVAAEVKCDVMIGSVQLAAHTCPVHQSLHPEVEKPIRFIWAEA